MILLSKEIIYAYRESKNWIGHYEKILCVAETITWIIHLG